MSIQKVCLGVEISQNGLKVALVEPKQKKVVKIDTVPTPSNSMHDISIYASVISSWTRSNTIPKITSVSVAFPSSSCIMRNISIPKEIEDADFYTRWEFESAINSKAGDYKLSTFFFPNKKNPERAVVSALRKNTVDSFCTVELEKSGFRPDCLIADLCALFNLLEYSEGLGSSVKCVLKADENFVLAFWANENGFLTVRFLPNDCIFKDGILDILESGFDEFPKAKRTVKFCGELSGDTDFTADLAGSAEKLGNPLEISLWDSVNKFSFDKNGEFSKLSQCLGAIGATLSCL